MKKNLSKVLLSAFTMLIVFSFIGSLNVTAVETPDQTIEVQGDAIQTQLQSNVRTMFYFREKTRLTVYANIGLELDINCEALRIGDKDVIIEVEGDYDLRMTMTCTREEAQLGLMKGSLHRVRNRNTYQYLEGFCIAMKCTANYNCECKCDPDCTCVCDCQCKCDPECTCPCVCDCECKCDPECDCQCKCDPVCDCQCKCDPVCDCQCKCDPDCTCACDCQCKCDPICDYQYKCDPACDCQCKCDPVCECQCKCDPVCDCQCKCDPECPNDGVFLKARLKIKETIQNRLSQWAYYDNENKEWVTVPTINQDGYLTAETNVLSTWTILTPEETTSAIVSTVAIGLVSAFGILAISVFYLKKKH